MKGGKEVFTLQRVPENVEANKYEDKKNIREDNKLQGTSNTISAGGNAKSFLKKGKPDGIRDVTSNETRMETKTKNTMQTNNEKVGEWMKLQIGTRHV